MKIFDLHCDTATELLRRGLPFDNRETQLRADRLFIAEHTVQCCAVFFNDTLPGSQGTDFIRTVCDRVFPQMQRPDFTPLLTVEGAGVLARDSETWPQELKDLGCVMAGLCWNGTNPLATGAVSDDRRGLSERGKHAVTELVRLGIVPDVSHLSAAGTEDLLSLTEAPIAASHSDARSIRDHVRNLTDDAAREIFRRGGVIGLNLYPPFLGDDPGPDTVLDHAERFFSLGGEDGVCLGCDFDGVERLPRGIRDFASLAELYAATKERFGADLANAVFYRNAARFFGIKT